LTQWPYARTVNRMLRRVAGLVAGFLSPWSSSVSGPGRVASRAAVRAAPARIAHSLRRWSQKLRELKVLFALSLASSIFATCIAIGAWLVNWDFAGFYCSEKRLYGENIDSAIKLVLIGGLAASLVTPFVRKRPLSLAALSAAGAVILSVAIGLVARDSAMYSGTRVCGFYA
jgi:hypothetical protein